MCCIAAFAFASAGIADVLLVVPPFDGAWMIIGGASRARSFQRCARSASRWTSCFSRSATRASRSRERARFSTRDVGLARGNVRRPIAGALVASTRVDLESSARVSSSDCRYRPACSPAGADVAALGLHALDGELASLSRSFLSCSCFFRSLSRDEQLLFGLKHGRIDRRVGVAFVLAPSERTDRDKAAPHMPRNCTTVAACSSITTRPRSESAAGAHLPHREECRVRHDRGLKIAKARRT